MSTQTPDLRTAAQAVIDRWETPLWKDAPATAGYIAALRDALAADHTEQHLDMVGRWYMVNKIGMALLCGTQADAEQEAADAQLMWPHMGPHRAVLLVEAKAPPPTTKARKPNQSQKPMAWHEQAHAIREGSEIAASEDYFAARPQIVSADRRKVFQAGFERGWDAARATEKGKKP